jgi:hypothetical protein
VIVSVAGLRCSHISIVRTEEIPSQLALFYGFSRIFDPTLVSYILT